jgi:hypothetical protein
MRMAEGRIRNPIIRESEYQFMDTDTRQQPIFGEQPIVGCALEIENLLQIFLAISHPNEDAVAAFTVFGRD